MNVKRHQSIDRSPTRRRRRRTARGGAAVALALAVSAVNVPRADALDPATVITAAKTAYSAYQLLPAGQTSLPSATTQIIGAVNKARTQIISHMDSLAVAEVRPCATTAVNQLENLGNMSPTVAEQFAFSAQACVDRIDDLMRTVADKRAVDQLGFALNAVGPVALISFANKGLITNSLRTTLRSANNYLVTRLYPSCTATPLFGDAEPGGMVEVMLRCKAFNGDVGTDTAFSRTPKTATYNFTPAANTATRNTARGLAQAVLPKIPA